MLLSSVIIILREVLEATLLIGVLLSLSKQTRLSTRWAPGSVFIGFVSAYFYSRNFTRISGWFEGMGQEVTNAFIQYLLYILILCIIVLLFRKTQRPTAKSWIISSIMALIVILSITHEGSEILIYLSNFFLVQDHVPIVIAGAVIGTSIGVSVGILIYFVLTNVMPHYSSYTGVFLLILFSGGMLSHATNLLIQADWLPSQLPIWNTSSIISEQSISGQLLYAIMGYEATPTVLHAAIYFGGLVVAMILAILSMTRNKWRVE